MSFSFQFKGAYSFFRIKLPILECLNILVLKKRGEANFSCFNKVFGKRSLCVSIKDLWEVVFKLNGLTNWIYVFKFRIVNS